MTCQLQAVTISECKRDCFQKHLGAESYFEEHGRWPDIVSYLESADSLSGATLPVLRKVTLPTDHADRLLVLLEREKVSRSYLMPSLDNIARDVVDRFRQA